MTGEEYLSHIGGLEYDIRRLEAELGKARSDMMRLQSMDCSREHVDGGEPADLADRISNMLECEKRLNAEWDRYINQRNQAKRLLAELTSAKYRAVLTEYYLLGLTWEAVAGHLDLDPKQMWRIKKSALREFDRTVRARHPGFLEDFKIKKV